MTPAKTIVKKVNICENFISKMLPYLSVTTSTLPHVLYIDGFKGISRNYKYQFALIDGGSNKKIVDIL